MTLKLDMVGIIVKDMPKALAFYRALGLAIPAEMDKEGHVEITLETGLRLAWDTHDMIRSFDADWQPPSPPYGISLAFLCESASDVDKTYKRLVEAGYEGHNKPFDAFWGQRYAQIVDPDGNEVDLFAPMG